jgi:toxin ParE1/3/4
MSPARSVRFTPRALADFDDIADYSLDRWGTSQVRDYMGQLLKTLDNLAQFPELGVKRSDLDSALYSFPTLEHLVFYRFNDHELVVRRILHKRRLPKSVDFE